MSSISATHSAASVDLASLGTVAFGANADNFTQRPVQPNVVPIDSKRGARQPDATQPKPAKGADKPTTIDNESRELLKQISRDYIMHAVPAAPVAYHIETGDRIGKESFIQFCANQYGDVHFIDANGNEVDRASSGLIWWNWNDYARRVVRRITMEPTHQPEDAGNPEEFNRWYVLKKSMTEPNYNATLDDAAPFINHLKQISDGDEIGVMYFLNWLAQLYQFPETKIPVAILMYSQFGGVGKNLVQRLLSMVFGKQLVAGVSGKRLQSNFMDAIEHKRIIFINELARSDKADGYEDFKTQVSEEDTQFEGKGRAAREVRNIAHYVITTNNIDCLPLMRGDRRIAVLMTTAKPLPEQYYKDLVAWIDGPGAAIVANMLRCWEFPVGWNPYAPAPQTDAARKLQSASAGLLETLMDDLFESRQQPFDRDLIVVDGAVEQLRTLYGATMKQGAINRTTVGKALDRICGEYVQMRAIDEKGESQKYRIYIARHAEQWKKATTAQRGDHMRTGVRPFDVSGTEEDSHD
jgi:hypothetical protein